MGPRQKEIPIRSENQERTVPCKPMENRESQVTPEPKTMTEWE